MTTYRVFYLPEPIREKANAKRQQAHVTWEELLDHSVSTEIPALVEAIQGLGLVPGKQKTRPARLPVSEEVLQALAAGSAQTGLPQTSLLLASLWRFVGGGATLAGSSVRTRGKAKETPPRGKKRGNPGTGSKRKAR